MTNEPITVQLDQRPGCDYLVVRVPFHRDFAPTLKNLCRERVGVNHALWDKGLRAWMVPYPNKEELWAALRAVFSGRALIYEGRKVRIPS